jgi:hypothetical protein
MNILLCLSPDQTIALLGVIVGFLQFAAIIFIGFWTIQTYHRITNNSTNATINSALLAEKSLLFNKLNGDLDRIIEYSIQYAYFEDEDYTKNHYRTDIDSTEIAKRENAIRYELFAIMNFNFVEDLFKYYHGDETEMSKQAHYTELIDSHREYWKFKIIEKKESGYELITPMVNRVLNIPSSK